MKLSIFAFLGFFTTSWAVPERRGYSKQAATVDRTGLQAKNIALIARSGPAKPENPLDPLGPLDAHWTHVTAEPT